MKESNKVKTRIPRSIVQQAATACLWLACAATVHAQGVLTVTPGRTIATSLGNGSAGYTGDGGPATAASASSPSAVAYDASGNIFLADSNNHVIREITKAGVISTVAGSGSAGFGGDGGPATAAWLDTPAGVAIDASGSLYIADSHNHRIRKVTAGVISTIAGNGTAGFLGDGGPATSASLALPSGVAVDTNGNIYIADTNNQRVRKITGATISTIAGNGDQAFSGDGGPATAASLDSPTGIAIDATGNVYIADRHNQRIRTISSSGNISTIAGSGLATFGGSYSGDGASATAATLANPTGISIDAQGNVYIADSGNNAIRQIGNGSIATIAGTGSAGFSGDSSPAATATLNSPRAVAADSTGNLAIADTLNQRLRSTAQPILSFASQQSGTASPSQTVTLGNSGTAPVSVSSVAFTGPFATTSGGSCSTAPITLAPGATCTLNIAFNPATSGPSTGSVVLGGPGTVPQTLLLTGNAIQSTSGTSLTSSILAQFVNAPITFLATVAPAGTTIPTGTMTFYAGSTAIGAAPLANGQATLTTTFPTAGSYLITAVYSGDANFTHSTSPAQTETIGDFNFTLASSSNTSSSQTIQPGQSANFQLTAASINGLFSFPITLSALNLPPGAHVSFQPATITLGSSPVAFTVTITTPATAMLRRFEGLSGATTALALLWMPFSRCLRRRRNPLLLLTLCIISFTAMQALTGCGSGSGFFAQPQKTYTIDITGTATNPSGATLQHIASVTLTVQ